MATAYKVTKDTVGRADCSDDAEVVTNISAGETVVSDEQSGGWYHTGKGWIYMMADPTTDQNNTKNPVCILEKANTTTASLDKGSSVTFSGNDVIYDLNGNLMKSSTAYIIDNYDSTSGIVKVTDGAGNFFYVNASLISTIDEDGTVVIPADIAAASTNTSSVPYTEPDPNNAKKSYFDTIMERINGNASKNSVDKDLDLRVTNSYGIFGMPYQYMEIADPRIDTASDSFGLTYADRIAARMPLMIMIPGTPEFLAGYSDKEKTGVIKKLLDLNEGLSDDLSRLVSSSGKYYGIKQDWPAYFKYVNVMCAAAARMMGLEDTELPGIGKLGDAQWENNGNDELRKKLNYRGGVAFYVNAENTVSESFGNQTTQSALLAKVNGLSDIGREINFIMGAKNTVTGDNVDKVSKEGDNEAGAQQKTQLAQDLFGSGKSVHNLLGAIGTGMTTVISGGKLMFPEIWQDSQFSRDYNVNIKLTSPDCDNLSIYLNIIVPYLHLLGFVAPHNVGVNGYVSPFLVRAYYKGMFNCDMGVIQSMSVTKGGEGNWTPSGIPTVIDIQISFKELYGTMTINNNEQASGQGILSNLILMDYIGNICGINIQEMDLPRLAGWYYAMYIKNKFVNYVYLDLVGGFENWLQNMQLTGFARLLGWGK